VCRHSDLILVFTCCFAVSACTTLPSMEEATGGIPVREIVNRIKCELADGFEAKDHTWLLKQPKFVWLSNWTAQVDLTLQVLDSSTFAPGGSVTDTFHNAYAVSAGPTSISTSGVLGSSLAAVGQNLVLGGGVNLNGQSQRTETLSFAISLAELERWRTTEKLSSQCAISDQMDLRGRLGLKEWIAESLRVRPRTSC
jgi:hypothetical protein